MEDIKTQRKEISEEDNKIGKEIVAMMAERFSLTPVPPARV